MTHALVAQGSSLVAAQQQAIGWIGQTILNQSVLVSCIDVFRAYAAFSLLMAPLALTLKSVQLAKPQQGH